MKIRIRIYEKKIKEDLDGSILPNTFIATIIEPEKYLEKIQHNLTFRYRWGVGQGKTKQEAIEKFIRLNTLEIYKIQRGNQIYSSIITQDLDLDNIDLKNYGF